MGERYNVLICKCANVLMIMDPAGAFYAFPISTLAH